MTTQELDALQALCDNDEPTSATVIVMFTALPALIAEVRRLRDATQGAIRMLESYGARSYLSDVKYSFLCDALDKILRQPQPAETPEPNT